MDPIVDKVEERKQNICSSLFTHCNNRILNSKRIAEELVKEFGPANNFDLLLEVVKNYKSSGRGLEKAVNEIHHMIEFVPSYTTWKLNI